ncbi:MAG: Crp/Fnr family transcriptional regulator [Rikenellaceae bacterium]
MDNLDFNFFCKSCTKSEAYRRENCFTEYKVGHVKAGEYLAYKGEIAKNITMIVRGSVITEMVLDSGHSYTKQHHNAPYPMGALALFAEKNHYRANFLATSDCDIISVKREDIENQIVKCRDFLRSYIAYNTAKFDIFANHLTVLTHKSLKSRVAFYLFSISQNGEFKIPKSLEETATYLCVERPSLSRILKQLTEDGVITYNRGEGKIINIAALKSILE